MSTEINLNKMLSVTIKPVESCQKPETVEGCQKPETVKILSNKITSRAHRSTRVRSNEPRTTLIMQRQQEELTELEIEAMSLEPP
jgi:hypothetical protein